MNGQLAGLVKQSAKEVQGPPRTDFGRGFLFGAIIGAILVNYGKTYFTGAFPEIWLFMLGGLFVVSTLFLPKGVVGVVQQWKDKRAESKALASQSQGGAA